jgi:hypothetical protein
MRNATTRQPTFALRIADHATRARVWCRPTRRNAALQTVLDGDIDAFIESYLLMWADKRKKLEEARVAAKN